MQVCIGASFSDRKSKVSMSASVQMSLMADGKVKKPLKQLPPSQRVSHHMPCLQSCNQRLQGEKFPSVW